MESSGLHKGMLHLLAGRYRAAKKAYLRSDDVGVASLNEEIEALCVTAARGDQQHAKSAFARIRAMNLTPEQRARLETAKAYARGRTRDNAAVGRLLREACDLDPSFPLSQLSLGRHLLFTENDPASARVHFENASKLAPTSEGVLLGMVSLEAQSGNVFESLKASRQVVVEHKWSLRGWLSLISSFLMSTPLSGRLTIVLLAMLAFLPWVGPSLAAGGLLLAVLALWTLRRTSPVLALYPSFAYVVFLAAYAMRWIILGRLIP